MSTLYLSPEGNSFTLQVFDAQGASMKVDTPSDPILQDALKCKTHKEVLRFLQSLPPHFAESQKVTFYHEHNFTDKEHSSLKGMAHECTVEKMRQFVKNQIPLSSLSTISEIFDHLSDPETVLGTDVSLFGTRMVRFKNESIGLIKLMKQIDTCVKTTGFDCDKSSDLFLGSNLKQKISTLYKDSQAQLKQKNLFTRFCSLVRNFFSGLFGDGKTSYERAWDEMGEDGNKGRNMLERAWYAIDS